LRGRKPSPWYHASMLDWLVPLGRTEKRKRELAAAHRNDNGTVADLSH
jgi:hypothetical protein